MIQNQDDFSALYAVLNEILADKADLCSRSWIDALKKQIRSSCHFTEALGPIRQCPLSVITISASITQAYKNWAFPLPLSGIWGRIQNIDPKSVTFFDIVRHFYAHKCRIKDRYRNLHKNVVILGFVSYLYVQY